MRAFLLSVVAFIVLAACPPQPAPPAPDASDGSVVIDASAGVVDVAQPAPAPIDGGASADCVAACKSLAYLNCAEGKAPNCARVLEDVQAKRLIRTEAGAPLTCEMLIDTNPLHLRTLNVDCTKK